MSQMQRCSRTCVHAGPPRALVLPSSSGRAGGGAELGVAGGQHASGRDGRARGSAPGLLGGGICGGGVAGVKCACAGGGFAAEWSAGAVATIHICIDRYVIRIDRYIQTYYIHIYIHTYIHTYAHTYTHTHTHTHTHTYR